MGTLIQLYGTTKSTHRMAGGHVALLEHAGADGADLGPVVGAEDGGHQVAAEGRTGPGHIAGFFVDVQGSAVGGQAGFQPAAHPGTQIPAVVGGTDEIGRASCRERVF